MPGIKLGALRNGKPAAPSSSIVTAKLKEKSERGRRSPEHGGVPLLPELPATKKGEGRRRLNGDRGRHGQEVEVPDVCVWRHSDTDRLPETSSDGAVERHVAGGFERSVAEGATSPGSIHDGLLEQHVARLDTRQG